MGVRRARIVARAARGWILSGTIWIIRLMLGMLFFPQSANLPYFAFSPEVRTFRVADCGLGISYSDFSPMQQQRIRDLYKLMRMGN